MSVADIEAAIEKQKEYQKIGVQIDALHEVVMKKRNTMQDPILQKKTSKNDDLKIIEVSESSSSSDE